MMQTSVRTTFDEPVSSSDLSPAGRLTVKRSALTPTTHDSSTPLSHSTIDTSFSQCSSAASATTPRLALPSPSRSRLDRRYAKRLAVLPSLASTSTSTSAANNHTCTPPLVPPPGIAREYSIFHPTPVVSPDITTKRQHFFSLAREASSTSTRGSTGSDRSIRRSLGGRMGSAGGGGGGGSSSSSSSFGASDRFIPSRATSNLNVNLWGPMNERRHNSNNNNNHNRSSPRHSSNNSNASSDDTGDGTGNNPNPHHHHNHHHNSNSNTHNSNTNDAAAAATTTTGDNTQTSSTGRSNDLETSSQQYLYNVLLRSELLGENQSPTPLGNASLNGSGPSSRLPGHTPPLRDGMNRLRFTSPRQAYQENIYNEGIGPTSVINSFSLTPVGSAASQRLMAAPQKRRRRIAKVPFKVLDAPALQDDFYLNLVDWSSQNVLAVGLGSCVYLWSACTSKVTKLCDLAQSEDIVTSVSWAQRGTHLAVGTNRGEVQLWDSIKCKKVRTMTGHNARVGTLAWSGPVLASGSRDRNIFLRDVRCQAPFTDRLTAHKQEVCGLKWSFDEPAFLASGGNDNQLHVVDSRNPGTPVHRFSDHTAAVKAIAWSPHQHGLLASGGGTADRCIRFWNTLSGSSLSCVDTGSQVCNLAWSQNCNEIVSTHGYSLNQIVVWRYPSLSKVVTLTGHTYRVLYLAMSPDGSTIVTGAGDETLRFWQVFPGPRSDGKNNEGGLLFPNTLGSVIR